jgi:hypothetical protein
MYYRDRGACFEGVGEDSTGAIPRRQAGLLLSIEKVGRPCMASPPPCSAVRVFLHAQERIRNSELIASVPKIN